MFNETSYNLFGLGDLSDYVRKGQALYYAVTVTNSSGDPLGIIAGGQGMVTQTRIANLRAGIQSNGFTITKAEEIPSSGSLAYNVIAPGDFRDSSDVKALFDGIVQEVGFRIRASMIRAGAVPLASGEGQGYGRGEEDPGILPTAGGFWGDAAGEGAKAIGGGVSAFGSAIGAKLGVPPAVVWGGLAVLGLLLFKGLR